MKRFLAILLTVLMLMSTLTCFTFAATISFLVNPNVFVGGDVYNIVWVTNNEGIGYVEYTYQGAEYRVYDEENGVVRTDDTIHTVQVPKEHLDGAGSYTAYSTRVESRSGYAVTTNNTVSVTRSFQGYHNQSEIKAWVLTDTHATNINNVAKAAANLPCSSNPDIVFMLGDMITFTHIKQTSTSQSSFTSAESICYIFRLAEKLVAGTRPIVYARGNHETRSGYSTYIKEYLGADTGELYYDFSYGPISSIVMDYGEDKEDTHHEYIGFAHFQEYYKKQTEWLNSIDGYPEKDTATYKLAISHGNTVKNHHGYNWVAPLSEYATDFMISGHSHGYMIYSPSADYIESKTMDSDLTTLLDLSTQYTESFSHFADVSPFPSMICGAHLDYTDFVATQLTFKDGKIITNAASNSKSYTTTFTVKTGINQENIIEGPGAELAAPAYKKPNYYAANDDDKVGSTTIAGDATFANITKPVVFDTGDNYTVVWATKDGVNATGEVRVHYNGAVYNFADHSSGYSNIISNKLENVTSTAAEAYVSNKNIHSAVVPKKYLEGGKYECVSRHLTRAGYIGNMELGFEVSTGLLELDGYDKGEDVEMLVVSQWNKADDMVSKLRNIVKTADVVVMGGDVASQMQSYTDFISFIYDLGKLTNGKKPVYFVRGESETIGEFAPYLSKHLKTDTNEFYAKVEFGPVSSVILDTGIKHRDSYVGYNNLVNYNFIRAKQFNWLKEQSYGDSEYNVVFSNASGLYDYAGYDFNKQLNAMGTDLAVFSSSPVSAFSAAGTRAQNYATATNGSFSGDGTVATKLAFKDGKITVTALNSSGNALTTNIVDTAANDAALFSDVAATAWYGSAVSYVENQAIMVGTSDNTFAPEAELTRGQAAVVLANLANADLTNCDIANTPFEDVSENAYYAKAIAWCYENGVTAGTGDNTFSPDSPATREQICTLICNLYGDKYPQADSCNFKDFDKVSDYAKGSVAALANAGVIVGTGDGYFAPQQIITRAQLAQIVYAIEK